MGVHIVSVDRTAEPSSVERRRKRTNIAAKRDSDRDAIIEQQLATIATAAAALDPRSGEVYRVIKDISDDAGWPETDYKTLINFFADNPLQPQTFLALPSALRQDRLLYILRREQAREEEEELRSIKRRRYLERNV